MTGSPPSASARAGVPRSVQTEFALALAAAGYALRRSMARSMAAVGAPDLSPLDIMILRCVLECPSSLRAGDIQMSLSRWDAHLVTYSLRKLLRLGHIERSRDRSFNVSPGTATLMHRYLRLRRECLRHAAESVALDPECLRTIAEGYDRAVRDNLPIFDGLS